LGKFPAIGRWFSLGSGLKTTEVAQIFWATFFHCSSYALILPKMGWATFWATFSANTSGQPDHFGLVGIISTVEIVMKEASSLATQGQRQCPVHRKKWHRQTSGLISM
jgi:hypothetical protein